VLVGAGRSFEVGEVPDVPWRERVLCADFADLELVNLHSPISTSPGLAKVLTHEAVHRHLSSRSGARVLCGDLNTPRREHPDGRVWTFARDRYGKLRPERGERWDRAELSLIKGLEPAGFRDAFRELHGYGAREPSWVWQRWGGGYRLDHLIVSEEVAVESVRYMHEWRDEGLSDHSALIAAISG
jgi:exonuclease III